ncbi:protein translocase subunit SecF [Paenibacillus swuensis]|uniref:protein translocase subunit SecF n=1 Tax=Paenibacillus swuensis TaxID=1178515 RepID=UPI0009EEBB5A|nr:protein translocase subunit SecF [Paenibacillus swuensis]
MDYKNRFDFIKNQRIFFGLSGFILVTGLIMMIFFSLNYGVDFKAGTNIEYSLGKSVQQDQVQSAVDETGLKLEEVTMGSGNKHTSLRFDEILTEDQIKQVNAKFAEKFGKGVSPEVNTVSPDIALELRNNAIKAVLIASVLIMIYVSIRFHWTIALAAVLGIFHDALIVIAFFAIFRFEVDLPFVAAVLTTVGYSINDKIVIFDRVRENLRFAKIKSVDDLSELVNRSVWQTMARTVNTVITVLIAAVCLFIFGSESIKLFALAKIIGLSSGVYSSICISVPLWVLFRKNALLRNKKVTA